MTDNDQASLRLSAQRALWGQIPPSLRAFSAEIVGQAIRLLSVFDESAADDDWLLLSEAGTEIMADYPSTFTLEESFVTIPISQPPEHLELLMYQRFEPANDAEGR